MRRRRDLHTEHLVYYRDGYLSLSIYQADRDRNEKPRARADLADTRERCAPSDGDDDDDDDEDVRNTCPKRNNSCLTFSALPGRN